MKNKLLLPLLTGLSILILTACAPRVYKTDNFKEVAANHKEIAILPSSVLLELRPNQLKKTTPEQIKETEEKTGRNIQDNIYSWLLRRNKKFKYSVTFQDVSRTNALLTQAGITADNIKGKTREELCQLLGVDAVLGSNVILRKPMSDAGAAALAIGTSILGFGIFGNTNTVNVSLIINEKNKGELIWHYDWQNDGSVGSTAERLVNALMRNAAKHIPYRSR
jgi:hypothetical protein